MEQIVDPASRKSFYYRPILYKLKLLIVFLAYLNRYTNTKFMVITTSGKRSIKFKKMQAIQFISFENKRG
jgi:hypothetical protein